MNRKTTMNWDIKKDDVGNYSQDSGKQKNENEFQPEIGFYLGKQKKSAQFREEQIQQIK